MNAHVRQIKEQVLRWEPEDVTSIPAFLRNYERPTDRRTTDGQANHPRPTDKLTNQPKDGYGGS